MYNTSWTKKLQDSLDKKQKELKMGISGVTNTKKEVFTKVGTGEVSDGTTASYYELPEGAAEIQDLISYKNMNAQVGEMFRGLYRYGQASHSDMKRDIKKVIFYGQAELERLEKYSK